MVESIGRQRGNMFYSHLLLSKKGPLGVVWMAAHCHKRLKKDQVQRINICASVDKILDDEVPVVTHRILAFLLLGVVRIFSKKVEYLCDDCNDMLKELYGFAMEESQLGAIGAPTASDKFHDLITLPNSFELDAFDLELHENQDFVGGNIRSLEEITLTDARKRDSSFCFLLKENTDSTPPRDFSPQHMDKGILIGTSFNMKISLSGLDVLWGIGFSLDDQMEPMVLDEDEEEQMHNNTFTDNPRASVLDAAKEVESNSVEYLARNTIPSVPSLEILCETVSLLEDHTDPAVLYAAGKEQTNDTPATDNARTYSLEPIQDDDYNHAVGPLTEGSNVIENSEILHISCISLEHSPSLKISSEADKGQGCNDERTDCSGVTEKHVKSQGPRLRFEEDEPPGFTEPIEKAESVVIDKRTCLEVTTSESMICQNMDSFSPSSISADPKVSSLEVITPESMTCQKMDAFLISTIVPDLNLSDTNSPNVADILTPVAKESGKILKKRKILVDSSMILPNNVIKNWIDDPSDLKRERRKVPRTQSQARREYKFVHATPSFIEPLLSGISEDLCFLQCEKNCAEAISAVELLPSNDDVQSPVTRVVNEQTLDAGSHGTAFSKDVIQSPVTHVLTEQILDFGSHVTESSPGQTSIAPRTPASRLFQLRSHEFEAIADLDALESPTSVGSIEKSSSSNEGLKLSAVLCDIETNSCDEDDLGNYTFSARTRMLGSHLLKVFAPKTKRMKRKRGALNMSHLMEGKTKEASARLFYEILVLKTQDYIDVQQEIAYGDIMLREGSNLKLLAMEQ